MKNVFFIFLLIPHLLFSQKIVILSVTQPPEFGFSVSRQDTTIVIGRSVVLGTDLVIFGGSGDYSYKWSPGAALNDSTIANPLATPLDTTAYLLTVTDKFGCNISVNYTVNARNPMVGSDIISNYQALQAVLFPNPNNGKFKVRLSGLPTKKIELTIFDNTGKVVKKHSIVNFNGELTEILQLNLVTGVYTLYIDAGTEKLNRQFIIN